MGKILKMTKKAVQTRNRVRMNRGINAIMVNDSTSLVNVKNLKEKMKINETIDERFNAQSNLRSDLRTWAIKKILIKELLQHFYKF